MIRLNLHIAWIKFYIIRFALAYFIRCTQLTYQCLLDYGRCANFESI